MTAFSSRPSVRLAAWALVIIALVVPWQSVQDHPHWSRIRWVPFVSPPVSALDTAGNVLLYMPFGYFASFHSRSMRWPLGIGAAAALSCATEIAQVFGHGRFPSVQDLMLNILGAAIGVMIGQRKRHE